MVVDAEKLNVLRALADALVGKCIWEVASHSSLGSSFTLEIGGRIALGNSESMSARGIRTTEEGEFGLYAVCSWRLEDDEKIIATWQDENDLNGRMKALEDLEGSRIVSAELGTHAWDLALATDNGLRIVVFCDQSASDESDFCYYLRGHEIGVSVLSGGSLELERRQGG